MSIEKPTKAEKVINEKILKLTMTIKDKHPELTKYIEELPVTIPDKKHPLINIEHLQNYYESLNSLLTKYLSEQAVR